MKINISPYLEISSIHICIHAGIYMYMPIIVHGTIMYCKTINVSVPLMLAILVVIANFCGRQYKY